MSLTFPSPSVSPSLSVAVRNVTNDIAADTSMRPAATAMGTPKSSQPMAKKQEAMATSTETMAVVPNDDSASDDKTSRYGDSQDGTIASWSSLLLPHDFTDCCRSLNVSHKCMRYCSVHTIFNRSTHYVHASDSCTQDFVHIVKCTAGGRNHVPCCQKKNIPDLCQVSEMHTHYDIVT